jgi:hypothetical protein
VVAVLQQCLRISSSSSSSSSSGLAAFCWWGKLRSLMQQVQVQWWQQRRLRHMQLASSCRQPTDCRLSGQERQGMQLTLGPSGRQQMLWP